MNVGGGEAADQTVRMMLTGCEVAVRLSGSALKNTLALTMALARNHKTISGKVNLVKMLKETRDVRRFTMTPEQYQQFKKRAGKQKLLFSAIRDQDRNGKVIDVILPVTEIDRANLIFERIMYHPDTEKSGEKEQEVPSKKDTRSGRDSRGTRDRSRNSNEARTGMTISERPSVEAKLKDYRAQLDTKQASAPTKSKTRQRIRPDRTK